MSEQIIKLSDNKNKRLCLRLKNQLGVRELNLVVVLECPTSWNMQKEIKPNEEVIEEKRSKSFYRS